MTTPRQHKLLEPALAVYVQIDGQFVQAGKLDFADDALGFQARFQYAPEYLTLANQGKAFALDPINLPLRPTAFTSSNRYHCLGALFDAAPDAWGRTIMAIDEGVSPESLRESQVLIKGKGSGVGAIVFGTFTEKGQAFPASIDQALPRINDINHLYKTITALESGTLLQDSLRSLLMSSWDIGGARPKAIIEDENGAQWITKFPRKTDSYSRQRVEWANLQMAHDIGLTVPPSKLHLLDDGDCALLVQRFDRAGQLRYHYLSAVSLISPPADFDRRQMDTPYGASIFSYARIADVIRAISSDITRDMLELFARMVLNILVHNTDDHLKNTGFLLDTQSPGFHYRLSPLFDVVTQEGTLPHLIHIGPLAGREGSIENALSGVEQWGIKLKVARDLVQRVQAVVARREQYYQKAGMSDSEIKSVQRWLGG